MADALKRHPEPFIELSVRVSDGSFESRLTVPVNSTTEQRNGFAKMWIEMLANAVKIPAEGDHRE